MSLFPAYASDDIMKDSEKSSSSEESAVTPAMERQLLASDEEPRDPPPGPPRDPPPAYYLDTGLDLGNLRVSTLYYPGRPEYHAGSEARALGAERRAPAAAARRRRYWHAAPARAPDAAPEAAARAAAMRAALAADPGDEDLRLRYIRFQAEWGAPGADLEAAGEAAACAGSPRVRDALHRARERHLPPEGVCAALRDDIAAERRGAVRLELWLRLVEALGAGAAERAAAAALAACPGGYPRVLYAHGCVLRAAGHWERLVLAIELTAAMNYPPAAGFPPPPDPAADRRREETALRREDEACRSGLPLNAVWARVERVRAAAHWRPAAAGADADPARAPAPADADPARAPAPADAAEVVRAARGAGAAAALAAALLRLAKVPLLPGSEFAARLAGPEPRAGEPATPETLAMLLRAARRLPAAHPARAADPAQARAALAPLLDPPHYFSDADGYLRWTNALWEACCGWMQGARRLAFLCWRLRWLHALARLADPAEARRLRGEARAAVRRHAPAAAEAHAHLARLEADVAGAAAGRRAALRAARAALADPAAAPEAALYAARVLADLEPGGAAAGWAVCCAALRRPLPPDAELAAPPPPETRAAALAACAARCDLLECGYRDRQQEEEQEEASGDVCAALLPAAGEWAAARVALAPPPERARLLARLLAERRVYRGGGAALQYAEQAACALALAAAGAARARAARALLPLFPGNALLALVCAGAPLWADAPAPVPSPRAGLALLVPRLLRAPLSPGAPPADATRLAGACARVRRAGAGGALAAVARLEAEARAEHPRPERALYAALADHPDHKWVYVRGAAWCGAEAAALADAVLERGLRAHALMDELVPLAAAAGTGEAPHDAATVSAAADGSSHASTD